MGSSSEAEISTDLRDALQRTAEPDGFITFESFMQVALYHPTHGYYRRDRDRVGRRAGTDFYTASSLGPIFGELIIATTITKLGLRDPANFTFIELGAETGRTVLDGLTHPFAAVRAISVDDEITITGPCIVFSNELFDAQPCARYVRSDAGWAEIGIRITETRLTESQRPAPPEACAKLPTEAPIGYHIDLPQRAADLAQFIANQPWHGLFIAFDYGKSWHELCHETPLGTVRAYFQHTQQTHLLARPGEQDLTCHICWDFLTEALAKSRFEVDAVRSQEAFFVKNASSALARIMQEEARRMSPRKAGLLQLLHPAALGQKFQGLAAWRDESKDCPCFDRSQTFTSDPFN